MAADISRGPSIPVDTHAEARWAEPVVTLPPDLAVKAACERLLNPAERRRFRCLHAEATRNGVGVRTAIKMALRLQIAETTWRLEAAMACVFAGKV